MVIDFIYVNIGYFDSEMLVSDELYLELNCVVYFVIINLIL